MRGTDDKPCPRNICDEKKTVVRFQVAKDPAVLEIARMVVAGIDGKYNIHPRYKAYVRAWGEKKAQELIRNAVEIPGACDVIQTMTGNIGLFGGLSENKKEFIFYEWTEPSPVFRVHMTHQEARDIVAGKKKLIKFFRCTKAHFATRKRAKEKLHEKIRAGIV